MTMGITPEQAAYCPKNRALENAIVVCHAVVYDCPDGLRATHCANAPSADELAVRYQRQGHRAWMVTLEGEGLLVHAD